MVNHYNIAGDNLTKTEKLEDKNFKNKHDGSQYINFAEDDQMEIQGFFFSKLKAQLCWVLYVMTLGALRLFFHWYPVLYLKATHSKCDLRTAEKVLITDDYNGKTTTHFVKKIITLNGNGLERKNEDDSTQLLKFRLADGQTKEVHQIRMIKCKKLTYIWDEDKGRFIKLAGLENGISRLSLHEFRGQSREDQIRKRMVYGNNEIKTPEQTILILLILEALTPFYIFQLFSLFVWSMQEYYYYGAAIVIMTVVGISTSIIQTRKNQRNLKGTVNFNSVVTICREDGTYQETSTTLLVPGDVIVVPSVGCEMYCDAVLLSGSCVVNESMLTGESVPITKTPLDHHETPYNLKEDVNHTLFCGTKVLQTRTTGNENVLAVVIRTGFLTTKGELVRSILYPPPADFKFDRDSHKFIGILAVIAALGFIYTVVSKISRAIPTADIIIKALDIITIVIPPALPAAMTVGKLFAIQRLKNSKIFCINSRVINVSGSVDCVCFDKTGTLTEDALDMWGVVPAHNQKMAEPVKNMKELPISADLFRGMATCHTLTSIKGEMAGDPLDLKMFQSTGWIFEDNHHQRKNYDSLIPLVTVRPPELDEKNITEEIGILKQFQFSSSLQRMSVIIKSPNRPQFEVFCKGSPEKIISLSSRFSVPDDIHQKLKEYTAQGYRVIGMARRVLLESLTPQEILKMHRREVEQDFDFLGLIILENRLKPETAGVIKTLKDALLKVVMITGDNIQTAVTVARECHIIGQDFKVIEVLAEKLTKHEYASISYHVLSGPNKEIGVAVSNGNSRDIEARGGRNPQYCLVISGQSWANVVKYFPDLISRIVTKGAVFARMSGSQKQQLVEQFKGLGYYVAMCGDGANDCGALKAAHVGISLSEAESSVASPFTSNDANISCTPKVIKEGRAALVTSFGVFQMMLCYSLTEFASAMILYSIDTNLSSLQFLFIDLCLILNFAATFGRTKAYHKLAKKPPRTSLLGFIPLSSIILFMALAISSQTFSYYFIQTYSWFQPFVHDTSNSDISKFSQSYENYAVFCTSMFQYITMTIIFSEGKPYRKNIFTNKLFVFSLVLMTIICGYITLFSGERIASILKLRMPPEMDGRWMCIWVALVTFIACNVAQNLIVGVFLEKSVQPALAKFSKNKKPYLEIIRGLENAACWPETEDGPIKILNVSENGKFVYENAGFINSDLTLNHAKG